MDVVNPCAALLSNYEVYKILKETREEQKKIRNNIMKNNLRNLNTIAYETLKYFENVSPCRYSTDSAIPEFVESVKEYQLSKSELLQLVNLRPTTHVELHAVIEECEERYTETQIASLLDYVRVHLLSNTRARTSDSVSSYLSPNEDYTPLDPSVVHNSSLSHEEEVILPVPRKKKKKKVKHTGLVGLLEKAGVNKVLRVHPVSGVEDEVVVPTMCHTSKISKISRFLAKNRKSQKSQLP
eukprot:sb/3469095/